MELSIVVANYNTVDFLRTCIASIRETAPSNSSYEIIVVDNASTDGSAGLVSSEFPEVRVLVNDSNVGFSKANNQGVDIATGRHILFLNPDTVLQDQAPAAMLRFMDDHPDAGAATCAVRLPNGELDEGCHRGFPTPWNSLWHFIGLTKIFPRSRLFAGYTLGWMDLSTSHAIDALVGAFMLVRREAGDEVGWWDEDYFFYGEDLDFCYRLKERGWKIYYVPSASILHYKGAAAGIKKESRELTTATRETRIRATRARFDAMRIFYRKHYLDRYPRPITWLVLRAIDLKEWNSLRSI